MKKTLKSIFSLILVLTLVFSFAACDDESSNKDDDEKSTEQVSDNEDSSVFTVGILQLAQHDALDLASKGFIDALTEKVTAAGKTVKFDAHNACGDPNQCSAIANKFISDDVDLIMANATLALQAAYSATPNIPILGTSVTEYGVALEIDNFNGVTGTNVSGTSDLAPLDMQAQMVIDLVPTAKKVGLIYCSTEANSLYQVKDVQAYLEAKGLECTAYAFEDSNDLLQIALTAAAECDAIYVPTDNTIASNAFLLAAACYPAEGKQVPVVAGEQGICKACGVATLSIDYYKLGRKTGEMAAEILLDDADITKMEIQYDEDVVYKYNPEFCKAAGITVPDNYIPIE